MAEVTAQGRLVTRRKKDAVRVAVGKVCAASPNHASKMFKVVRSSHLGYDCYAAGMTNGVGKIRCVLRPRRLPTHITTDIVGILPTDMWWPVRDHEAAHHMIDAVLTFDLGALASWKASFPEHCFGYEQFMELAERRAVALREHAVAPLPKMPGRLNGEKTAVSGGSVTVPRQFTLFPAPVESLEPASERDYENYVVRTHVARFEDGQAALRVSVGGILPDGSKLLCSRAYVDLVDGRFEIIEHYPGRLRGLNLPLDLIYQVLGARSPRRAPTRRHQQPWVRPIRHSERTSKEAEKIQAMFSAADPAAKPSGVHRPEPTPVPVAGNARYEASLADNFEQFPESPGHAPASGS